MADEEKPENANPEPVSDADHPAEQHKTASDSRIERLKSWYLERKRWTIPASVILLILILAGLPFTRYNLAGLVIKKDFSIRLLDDTTKTPVSGVTVTIGGKSAESDGTGKVTVHGVKVGSRNFIITKKYYASGEANLLVPILKQKQVPEIEMTATGRQVKVTVHNLINKNLLSDVDIDVAGISAKTDKNGSATIVLPAGISEQKASLSLKGFNDSKATVKVSNDKIQENDFNLTPAGKVYFLSKLSGKIDVVKTNLDGTDRQTVLAGTGREDDNGTVLLASRDWKYLALLSRRAGDNDSLYLIDTSDDSLSTIDQGDADFTLAGWAGDSFVYTVTRNSVQQWQANREILKSYNAQTKRITPLDQTNASGTSPSDFLSESFGNVYAYDSQLYYTKGWNQSFAYSNPSEIQSKSATFNSIKADGTSKRTIRSFTLQTGPNTPLFVGLDVRFENPEKIELSFYDGSQTQFYVYANGQVKSDSSITADSFYAASYPTYLESPSADQTFWGESRDGKNTLFLGDEDGQDGKQIATLSDYSTYGWYTDNYLLVSKNSSELYAMSKDGKNVIKIADYHKPALSFPGYGGGYGGL
jgi:hypothetical protein